MKRFLILVVALFASSYMMAQSEHLKNNKTATVLYESADVMPEYPGGMAALGAFLSENIEYPLDARETGIQGKVYVGFIVEADGEVTNVNVLKGIGGGCDEEAARVVKMMPKWKPGTIDGKKVRVKYTLPISFKLN